MWQTWSITRETDPYVVNSIRDLLEETARSMMLATAVVYVIWLMAAAPSWNVQTGLDIALVSLPAAAALQSSLVLLRRHPLIAQWIWLISLTVAISTAIFIFNRPEISFFYVFLPLVAAVTLGWPAALVVEAAIIGMVLWLSFWPVGEPLPLRFAGAFIAGGAISGITGWAATRASMTVAEWSLQSYARLQQVTDELRERQVELKQTQADLLHANQELARLTDRLRAMNYVAEEARRAKEQFVANVSHELRTPLNMIIGFSEMITGAPHVYGSSLPPALLTDIAAIKRNSEHLAKLVDDVLDLSAVDAGRLALVKERIALGDVIAEAIATVRTLYSAKKLYLNVDVQPDLPTLYCDRTRVRQILINLLSNAGRFTERGGVTVTARCSDSSVVVSIADTGPGIAPDDVRKLFEPFQQLDASIRRRHGGSGLGLAISKRFVEMHEGKMWVESQRGSGTTISFSLPLDTYAAALPDGEGWRRWIAPDFEFKVRSGVSKAPVPRLRPRFVVVETDNAMQRLLARYMSDAEVVPLPDLDSALCELSRSPANALLVNTPLVQDPRALLDQLAHLPLGTPAIASWLPGRQEALLHLNVAGYLVKPVTREALLTALQGLGVPTNEVLIVDDEPEVLRLFGRMLASAEHRRGVLFAESGARALQLLRMRQPSVVLLDLIMPGMDGFQVLQAKSQDPTIRDIPVIVVSSRDPSGHPTISQAITVTKGGGLSAADVLACICDLSRDLAPPAQLGQGQQERPAS